MRVAFALHVARREDSAPPGGLRTLDRGFLVIHAVVAKDFSFQGIGGDDNAPAMDEALSLIKIYGLGYVAGNN